MHCYMSLLLCKRKHQPMSCGASGPSAELLAAAASTKPITNSLNALAFTRLAAHLTPSAYSWVQTIQCPQPRLLTRLHTSFEDKMCLVLAFPVSLFPCQRWHSENNTWLPQASYPCGNFSDTSSFKFRRSKGSIGHAFTVRIRTGNQNQTSFYPFVPHEISVLVELILGHLRYLLTDVPPQPNSPPDNVFRPDRPASGPWFQKEGRCPASDSRNK